MRITKELVVNTLLAAFWAGAAVVTASDQPFSKAAIVAGVVAAIRFAVGAFALASKTVPAVPVDE